VVIGGLATADLLALGSLSPQALEFLPAVRGGPAAGRHPEIALANGGHTTVLWAVERGLALAPSREARYQAWMHALGRSGDAQRLKDVYGRCWSMLRSEIHATQAPSAETELIWRSYLQR